MVIIYIQNYGNYGNYSYLDIKVLKESNLTLKSLHFYFALSNTSLPYKVLNQYSFNKLTKYQLVH